MLVQLKTFVMLFLSSILIIVSSCKKEPLNENPSVTLSANYVTGFSPLKVTFTASGIDPDGEIVRYEWDFEGDGIVDESTTTASSQTFTYKNPGSYTATLKVTDDKEGTATATQVITVGQNPPTVTATASPTTGFAPLKVKFTGSGKDSDGSVVKYEWDFEGDGTVDYSSTENGNTRHTYTKEGTYEAILTVTDNEGATSQKKIPITVKTLTFKYKGFEKLEFSVGTYWTYKWTLDQKTNGRTKPQESGFVTISLTQEEVVDFSGIGEVKLYKTKYTSTGDQYSGIWKGWEYIGVKDGVIYIAAKKDNGQWGAAILFSSQTGDFYGEDGFIGYFSDSRQETLTENFIANDFSRTYSATGVIVSEPFFDPQCETIAGVEICDDEYHNYEVKEYYISGIGFGGFIRSGTSAFSGGGFYDTFQTVRKIWIVDTNIK